MELGAPVLEGVVVGIVVVVGALMVTVEVKVVVVVVVLLVVVAGRLLFAMALRMVCWGRRRARTKDLHSHTRTCLPPPARAGLVTQWVDLARAICSDASLRES